MVKFDVNGIQNVEVSKKIPCEKPLLWQLELMERYTKTHRKFSSCSKERREAECLKVLFPALFREIEETDLFAGRLDFLPIGFGAVTSVGGVGHYCVFAKLRAFEKEIGEAYHDRVEALYQYWLSHDLKTRYCKEVLTETTIGRFIDVEYPLIATARLSGMMLDYRKLLDLGIGGLRAKLLEQSGQEPDNEFIRSCFVCLDIYKESARYLAEMAYRQRNQLDATNTKRYQELTDMAEALEKISSNKPETFLEALQALWLYALLAGCINYGRLDELLGSYLARDLDSGRMTEEQAYAYVKSLWTMVENRRTTVNGRIIVGGKGRKNPEDADRFLHIAMKVAKDCRYVEPQFTLRVDENTSEEIWDEALEALGAGATYPTIYNDEVNVPAVAYGMRWMKKLQADMYLLVVRSLCCGDKAPGRLMCASTC